jgi:hypothetical protein
MVGFFDIDSVYQAISPLMATKPTPASTGAAASVPTARSQTSFFACPDIEFIVSWHDQNNF